MARVFRARPETVVPEIARPCRPSAPCCQRVIARDGDTVDGALVDCSGREEMGRLHSSEEDLRNHVGD